MLFRASQVPWTMFSRKWVLSHERFDTFFDVACALTNLDVLVRPLQRRDAEFNRGLLNIILMERQRKAERQRIANETYLRNRRDAIEEARDHNSVL